MDFHRNRQASMKIHFLAIILLTALSAVKAQQPSNVEYHREKQHMVIRYDLDASGPARVYVHYIMGKDTTRVPDRQLEGDAGIYVEPGRGKQIKWTMSKIDSSKRAKARVILQTSPFIDMVPVNGGTFRMGCTQEQVKCGGDEKPVHRVTLGDYAISRYEITNAQYAVFLNQTGADEDGRAGRTALIHIDNKFCQISYRDGTFIPLEGKERHPVVEVTWNGAQAFCQWAGGSLPSEAQWEYAARGGHKANPTIYSGSNKVDSVAWYDRNSKGHTHRVGSKKPNELGIYDMSGNVWEWCFDWYSHYTASHKKNPRGPRRGQSAVVRGGSWLYYGSFCRVSNRGSSAPTYAFNNYGFRLVKDRE